MGDIIDMRLLFDDYWKKNFNCGLLGIINGNHKHKSVSGDTNLVRATHTRSISPKGWGWMYHCDVRKNLNLESEEKPRRQGWH